MISADGKATFCPKFLGLSDMVRYSGPSIPSIIDVRYNLKGLPGGLWRFFRSVALSIGVRNPLTQAYAAVSVILKQRKYQGLLLKGLKPVKAFEVISGSKEAPPKNIPFIPVFKPAGRTRVALLGYPYAIYDPFISAGIYDKLKKLGVEVVTFEQIPQREMRRYSKVMPQNFFWYYSNQVCWAGRCGRWDELLAESDQAVK